MKTLMTLIAAGLLTTAALAADSAPIFQMRLVAETPSTTSEPMTSASKWNDKTVTTTLNVEKAVLLDQAAIKSARVGKDSFGHPVIDITLTKSGAEQFATVTQENLHKRLAIVIDGHLASAPTIQAPITGGKAQISGSFSNEEAADLAKRINASVKK